MEWYGYIILLIIFIVIFVILITSAVNSVRAVFTGKPKGSACNLDTDCAGWGPDPDDTACCNGICVQKAIDYINVGYCPADCAGCFGCPLGTCGNYSIPRAPGEPCALDTDCAGWGINGTDMSCCSNVCTQKQRDYLAGGSIGFCPATCKGLPDLPGGTCSSNWSIPRKQGEPCDIDSNCENNLFGGVIACCNNRCVTKDETIQTCRIFCTEHSNICNAPLPN